MKSALELRLNKLRITAEELIKVEHGPEALKIICSFSGLDCIIDVKLSTEWVRYVLVQGGEGENDDSLRRIN